MTRKILVDRINIEHELNTAMNAAIPMRIAGFTIRPYRSTDKGCLDRGEGGARYVVTERGGAVVGFKTMSAAMRAVQRLRRVYG
jgi:hypothetical protein